jgi:hypothetical protein
MVVDPWLLFIRSSTTLLGTSWDGGTLTFTAVSRRMRRIPLLQTQRRSGDFASGGECCCAGLPAEDGKRRSAGRLSSAWKSGGILPCVDQKQARPAPVSRAWTPESENGNAVGLPHLQSATVDPFAKTANRASHRLDSENAKAKKPRVKIAAWIEETNSSHAPQKTAVRAVSSRLQFLQRVYPPWRVGAFLRSFSSCIDLKNSVTSPCL